jgi:hypothetical protein
MKVNSHREDIIIAFHQFKFTVHSYPNEAHSHILSVRDLFISAFWTLPIEYKKCYFLDALFW